MNENEVSAAMEVCGPEEVVCAIYRGHPDWEVEKLRFAMAGDKLVVLAVKPEGWR